MQEWVRQIREGDLRALARAASGVENRDPRALELLRELAPFAGHARVIGITGPPGAGKSTLVDAIASALRKDGKTVAVLAVDPTSHLTGGAILGDRIRMQQHHADSGMFIRSIATRGSSGGLARATADLVRLMDESGRDYVLIETVGVGQDEIEVARVAQVTIVVLVPGLGDDVQTIKAGIMEIADIFAINKSDHPGADRVELELKAMLSLGNGRQPAIIRTVATEGKGIPELLQAVGEAAREPRHQFAAKDQIGIAVQALEAAIPGLHHVALRVPDLDAAVESLQASGARLLDDPNAEAGGHRYIFVHPSSTGGMLLELIQEDGR